MRRRQQSKFDFKYFILVERHRCAVCRCRNNCINKALVPNAKACFLKAILKLGIVIRYIDTCRTSAGSDLQRRVCRQRKRTILTGHELPVVIVEDQVLKQNPRDNSAIYRRHIATLCIDRKLTWRFTSHKIMTISRTPFLCGV